MTSKMCCNIRVQGPIGIQGPTGPQGPAGPQGPTTLAIGTTTTVAGSNSPKPISPVMKNRSRFTPLSRM